MFGSTETGVGAEFAKAVDSYVALDPAQLDPESLGRRILELNSTIRRLQAAQAAAVRVFDATDASISDGMGTAATWLAARVSNVSLQEARGLVGMSRSLIRLPLAAGAFQAGAVSAAHVRILAGATRAVDPRVVAEGEEFLVGLARRHDPAMFARIVTRWVATVAPEEFEKAEERKLNRRSFSLAQTFEGIWHLAGTLDPEAGLRLFTVLEARARRAGPEDDRTRDQRWADALASFADGELAHGELPTSAGHRPEVVVLANAATVARESTEPALLAGAGPMGHSAFERICCDARWRRLLRDAAGVPVELGRATREFTPGQAKLIILRDGRCRYSDCPMPASACEAHHVRWWSKGGSTDCANGVLLCRFHHHSVHDRGHELHLYSDGRLDVVLPDGRVLTSWPRGPTEALLL